MDVAYLRREEHAAVVRLVDNAQHDGQQRHAEDVVAVGEETSAGHQDGANVVPSKRSLVDLGERQAAALVGVLNVGEVIVEVVKGVLNVEVRS
jgi:hypothetical protein